MPAVNIDQWLRNDCQFTASILSSSAPSYLASWRLLLVPDVFTKVNVFVQDDRMDSKELSHF